MTAPAVIAAARMLLFFLSPIDGMFVSMLCFAIGGLTCADLLISYVNGMCLLKMIHSNLFC